MTYPEQQFDLGTIPAYYLVSRINLNFMSAAFMAQIMNLLPIYDLPDISMVSCIIRNVYLGMAISVINTGEKFWPSPNRPTGYSESVPNVESQWIDYLKSFYAHGFNIPNITADKQQDKTFPDSSVYSNTPVSKRSTQDLDLDMSDNSLFAFLNDGEPLGFDPNDDLATSIPPYARQVADEGILRQIIASRSNERRDVSHLRAINMTEFILAHEAELYALSLLGYTSMRQFVIPYFLWLNYASYENARGFIRDVSKEAPTDFWSYFSLDHMNGQCGGFDVSMLESYT